jgi:hypothetical protein
MLLISPLKIMIIMNSLKKGISIYIKDNFKLKTKIKSMVEYERLIKLFPGSLRVA